MRLSWIAGSKLILPSRLCASLTLAYLILNVLELHQTLAVNGDTIAKEDHNHPKILDNPLVLNPTIESGSYEPDFVGIDRSIIGRAEEDVRALANNEPGQLNIDQGEAQFWRFPKQALFGQKSASTPGTPSALLGQPHPPDLGPSGERLLYISLNTCLQPTPKESKSEAGPKQLKLYISTNPNNKQPGLTNHDYAIEAEGGFWSNSFSVKDDVYFSISAPDNDEFTGGYNYQLTASIDGFFTSYYNEPNVAYIDSDTSSVLLYTRNLTDDNATKPEFHKWLDEPPRFRVFVQNHDNPLINGMQRSACALQDLVDVRAETAIDTGMTSAGDNKPKQQFYVRTLNASSSYYAITAIFPESTTTRKGMVGGGGIVWGSLDFATKSNDNCGLLYNLSFCDSVAYSAPANFSNPMIPNISTLAQHYDDFASSQYLNFSRSLQQIACNTTSSAQYSLTRNCTDCDRAYRKWLCAVTIPRCEDWSKTDSHLLPRAVNQNSTNETLAAAVSSDPFFNDKNRSRTYYANSRNPMIDSDIRPGPYKEMLPCVDLCYELVQSCPASLGFVCPLEKYGLNWTYGFMKKDNSTEVTCSFPGAGIKGASDAVHIAPSMAWITLSVALVVMAT